MLQPLSRLFRGRFSIVCICDGGPLGAAGGTLVDEAQVIRVGGVKQVRVHFVEAVVDAVALGCGVWRRLRGLVGWLAEVSENTDSGSGVRC